MTTTNRWLSWVAAVTLGACGGGSGGDSPDAFIPAGADAAGADGSGAGDPDAAPPAACARLAEKHARADQALAGFLLEFWKGDAQYLRAEVPGDQLSAYWVYAQAFDAVLDGVERTGGARYRGLVASLAAGQQAHGWNSDYYDDENWLALALVRAYDLTGERAYLDRAELLFQDIQAAWDESCCGGTPGGVWWDRAHTQKATASNGGPVITGARLAARTGRAAYLDFARQAYAYWRANMVDPVTHQVADHIAPDGNITRWRFTYNEGVMIGGALELYAATGEPSYLDDARAFAAFMRASETAANELGLVLSDGGSGCGGDCQQFKGIGYRYLDALERVAPDPANAAVLEASADSAWTRARDPNGHFGTDWSAAAPAAASTTIMQMSAALSALSLDASRCGAYPGPASATRFEAEDGFLRRVGLEAHGVGYGGWGYLAGWNGAGQGVELRVSVPAAGSYEVSFRYAADAGEAVRRVSLGDAVVTPTLHFPPTGGWDHYAEVSAVYALPAGASRLTVDFDAASATYLNLDYVDVAPAP